MNRPMDADERAARDCRLDERTRALHRLRAKGPWHDPVLEADLTGKTHEQKIAEIEHHIEALALLR